MFNNENQKSAESSSAAYTKPSTQTAFVESSVRQGWRILDVQMWQNLCKKLATLSDDSELAMMLLLGIADEHGISPIQLCAYARDEGYKQLEMDAVQHLAQMYGIDVEANDDQPDYQATQATDGDDDDDDSGKEGTATDAEVNAFIDEPKQFGKRIKTSPLDGADF